MIKELYEEWTEHFAEAEESNFFFNYISSYNFNRSPWRLFRDAIMTVAIEVNGGAEKCSDDLIEKVCCSSMPDLINLAGQDWLSRSQKLYSRYCPSTEAQQ